ncbi:hypothetical protein LPH50_04685 [Xylella taiwanensis]|uniref:Transposase n=1 Tax=Xylella taiwanensis TaxID=1444770 RepID=A0ABS8TRH4_9GAMM|nr:hypothetical protein [Xylella taiwanensis]MCD8457680.1 hypothetical protein [Xylella taiwanensis]MCD8459817.1 hypothetical protein [Xylella taiwanensis]MCD8464122.1 hypothetical protein [Xylella taiwanensis]MCD8464320.1 hypothetical protein [Xylella taiwanensis]MCD8468119.1 hypothetical protein [Xylella taiwanensis]
MLSWITCKELFGGKTNGGGMVWDQALRSRQTAAALRRVSILASVID